MSCKRGGEEAKEVMWGPMAKVGALALTLRLMGSHGKVLSSEGSEF